MGNIKETNIKNRTYYFFNDMINIKDFDSSLLKINKKSYKSIGIYNIKVVCNRENQDSVYFYTFKFKTHQKSTYANPTHFNPSPKIHIIPFHNKNNH